MKKIIFLCIGLAFSPLCLASPVDHFISKMTTIPKTTEQPSRDPDEEGYPDFTGSWVGTCSDDPERTDTFNIDMAFSTFIIDGDEFEIDGITTNSTKTNLKFDEKATHFHWSQDGSQLLATSVNNSMSGYMSTGKMETIISNMILSLDNKQLVIRMSGYLYLDGTHREEMDMNTVCTYSKTSA